MEDQKQGKVISFIKIKDFIRRPDLKPLEKCLFLDLIFYAGTDGNAFPSEESLGKDLGFTARHIRTQLTKLERKGLIISKKRRGYLKSNSYSLNEELYFRNEDSDRNSSSSHLGTPLPVDKGSTIPSKVNNESNQLNVVQQLFEKAAKRNCDPSDLRRLHNLCEVYSFAWVEDAIKEAAGRNLRFLEVGLLANILKDWKTDGKPPAKPVFHPCGLGKCGTQGMWFEEERNVYVVCECKQQYDEKLDQWKKDWGGQYA